MYVQVIKERQEESLHIKAEITAKPEVEVFGKKRRLAFLDLLMESTCEGKKLDINDLRVEVDTFMAAVIYLNTQCPELMDTTSDCLQNETTIESKELVFLKHILHLKLLYIMFSMSSHAHHWLLEELQMIAQFHLWIMQNIRFYLKNGCINALS